MSLSYQTKLFICRSVHRFVFTCILQRYRIEFIPRISLEIDIQSYRPVARLPRNWDEYIGTMFQGYRFAIKRKRLRSRQHHRTVIIITAIRLFRATRLDLIDSCISYVYRGAGPYRVQLYDFILKEAIVKRSFLCSNNQITRESGKQIFAGTGNTSTIFHSTTEHTKGTIGINRPSRDSPSLTCIVGTFICRSIELG